MFSWQDEQEMDFLYIVASSSSESDSFFFDNRFLPDPVVAVASLAFFSFFLASLVFFVASVTRFPLDFTSEAATGTCLGRIVDLNALLLGGAEAGEEEVVSEEVAAALGAPKNEEISFAIVVWGEGKAINWLDS